jgi:predicted membrane chloride channel (bestrophin family)
MAMRHLVFCISILLMFVGLWGNPVVLIIGLAGVFPVLVLYSNTIVYRTNPSIRYYAEKRKEESNNESQ